MSSSTKTLCIKKTGFSGCGKALSLVNIVTTDVIFGLSLGWCCTHKRPIWIHRKASDRMYESFKHVSMNSIGMQSFQHLHAYNNANQLIKTNWLHINWSYL